MPINAALSALARLLSPREADARVIGEPGTMALLRAVLDNPSQEYLPQQYRRIIRKAEETPETVNVQPAPGLMQAERAAGAFSPGSGESEIVYDPSILQDDPRNVVNVLAHELTHFLAMQSPGRTPSGAEQHRLIGTFLGSPTYAPAQQLEGYTPAGSVRDLELFEQLLNPRPRYYRTQ